MQAVLRSIVGCIVEGRGEGFGVGDAVQIDDVGKAKAPTILKIAGFQLIQVIFEPVNALAPIEITLFSM